MFQAESVRDAAYGCDWVGTAIPFQRCLMFIIANTNKDFKLTAGKFVPVSNLTTMNVCMDVCMHVSMYECMYICMCMNVCMYVRKYVCKYACMYVRVLLCPQVGD